MEKLSMLLKMSRRRKLAATIIALVTVSLVVGVFVVLAAAGTEIDMTIADNSDSYNDAIFTQGPLDVNSAGTGVLQPFLKVSGTGNQAITKGYNTVDASAEFDTDTGGDWTKPILLSGIPEVEIGGIFYREFKLDINKNRGGNSYMALNELKLFLTEFPDITGYDAGGVGTEFGSDALKVWDLGDAVVLMDYALESGSGASDVSFFVKSDRFTTVEDCSYGSADCETFLVMWNEYGNYENSALYPTRTWENNDGFEEWSVVLRPVVDAEKSAEGSYDKTITWELDKSIDDDYHSGSAGELAGSSNWSIVVTKTVDTGNIAASGTITVYNPTGCGDATVCPIAENVPAEILSIEDVIDQGGTQTGATITSCNGAAIEGFFPYTLDGQDTLTCTYEASPTITVTGVNTATITVDVPEQIGGGTNTYMANADLSFNENVIGYESGELTDDRFPLFSETVNSNDDFTLPEDFYCSSDANDYTDGHYQYTEINWAYLDNNIDLSDSASVTVDCYLDSLVPSKDAFGSYDRTVTWELKKNVNEEDNDFAEYSGVAGDDFFPDWLLYVDKTEVSDNYGVSGTITVSNPAAISQTFTISDTLNDGTDAVVTCPSYTVPAGGEVVCSYLASTADGSATLNTVTVSAPGNDDQTADAAVSFEENLIGYDSGELTDDRFIEYIETVSDDFDDILPETFECSTDPGDYTDGGYTETFTNTAYLNNNINLEDDAAVKLICTLPPLGVEKTAAGEWDRTVRWALDKSVDDDYHSGYAGEVVGTSNWTVEVTKTVVGPENFVVSGVITISNSTAVTQTVTDVDDVLDDATVATVDCGDDFPIDIGAGGELVCTYEASPADDSATENEVTVSAEGNEDQTATDAIEWSENLDGYDEGTLSDDNEFNPYPDELITDSTTWTYGQEFECSSDTELYENGVYSYTVPNTATLNDNINLSDSELVTVECFQKATKAGFKLDGLGNPMPGWTIELWDITGTPVLTDTAVTGGTGAYLFEDIMPGRTYAVCEVLMSGYNQIYPDNQTTAPDNEQIYDCTQLGQPADYFGHWGYEFYADYGDEFLDNNFHNEEPLGCTLTQGYWKTHSIYGPAGPADDNWYTTEGPWAPGVDGPDALLFSSELTWLEAFNQAPKGGNAWFILAHQWMAAYLNFYGSNAGGGSAVIEHLSDGAALLNYYSDNFTADGLPFIPKDDSDFNTSGEFDRDEALRIALWLDDYNNGLNGPLHCGD